jgi:hypothetical protein
MAEQYVKVETRILGHPKFLGLSMAARGVWLTGLLYAKGQLTGGRVQAFAMDFATGCGPAEDEWIQELLEHGLWAVAGDGDGWVIHGYSDHQTDPDFAAMGRHSAASRRARYGTAQPPAPERIPNDPSVPVPNVVRPNVPKETETGDRRQETDIHVSLSPDDVTRIWNENRGPLPGLRKTPETGELARLLERALVWFTGDAEAMARSVRRVAGDEHYQAERYGFQAWARHLDRWDDPGEQHINGGNFMPLADPLPAEIDPEGQARIHELLAGAGM